MPQPITKHAKLCILRLSAIGDVCHAVAMITHIQQARPDIEITWVIGKIEYQLVKHLPDIRFVVFDKKQGKAAFNAVKLALQETLFDALLVMQVAFRANWLSRQIKAKQRIGFDWARSKELHWLFTNTRIEAQSHRHVLEGFLDFSAALGISSPDNPSWRYPIPGAAQQWFDQPNGAAAGLHNVPYAVINPSASKPERNWLTDRYAAVATHLLQAGVAVVLTGGPAPAEQALGKQIIAEIEAEIPSSSLSKVHNLIGKTHLTELAVVLKQAKLVIAPDTGPAHIAAMLRTPVIALYAHSNPRRTGPYRNDGAILSVYDDGILQQTGKPWQQLPWGTRAKGDGLMAGIQTEDVIRALEPLLV